jgi:hypothetical protein
VHQRGTRSRIDATDRPRALIALELRDATIVGVRIINNPKKLVRLTPASARGPSNSWARRIAGQY